MVWWELPFLQLQDKSQYERNVLLWIIIIIIIFYTMEKYLSEWYFFSIILTNFFFSNFLRIFFFVRIIFFCQNIFFCHGIFFAYSENLRYYNFIMNNWKSEAGIVCAPAFVLFFFIFTAPLCRHRVSSRWNENNDAPLIRGLVTRAICQINQNETKEMKMTHHFKYPALINTYLNIKKDEHEILKM